MAEFKRRYEGIIDSIHPNRKSFQIWTNELNNNILGLPRNLKNRHMDYIVGDYVSFEVEPNPKRIGGFIATKIDFKVEYVNKTEDNKIKKEEASIWKKILNFFKASI